MDNISFKKQVYVQVYKQLNVQVFEHMAKNVFCQANDLIYENLPNNICDLIYEQVRAQVNG